MAEKRGGRVALLIVLAAESGLHTSAASSFSDATPFQPLSSLVRAVMRAPNRPTLSEDKDRRICVSEPGSSRIRSWKQQVVESIGTGDSGGGGGVQYEAVVASPKVLVLHLQSWVEVMDRAILEECWGGSNSGAVYPKVSSIMRQFAGLFDSRTLRTIRGLMHEDQRPDREELRALQSRFEAAMRSLFAHRLDAFVHELFYCGVTAR